MADPYGPPNPGGVDPYNPAGTRPYLGGLDTGTPAPSVVTDPTTGAPSVAGLNSVANPEVAQPAEMVTPAGPPNVGAIDTGEPAPFGVVPLT